MRQINLRTILTWLAIFCSIGVKADVVTVQDALRLVKNVIMSEKPVSYYLKEQDEKSKEWVIFVDMHPNQNWCHEAYLFSVPKNLSAVEKTSYIPKKVLQTIFPDGDFSFLEGVKRQTMTKSPKNLVPKRIQQQDVAFPNLDRGKTYAIILSGGSNKNSNAIRYWNDCSYIYQTLRNRYNIPKNNIIPLMADGDDPEVDSHSSENNFFSQDLDLDGDGEDDIELAATKSNLAQAVYGISSRIQKDDHLFVFVIDHGGSNGLSSNICLWGGQVIWDYEFRELLANIERKGANISMVLGQCFSGGFIRHFSDMNCVIATACKADQKSYSTKTVENLGYPLYDEFVYWWISAVNGCTPNGQILNADKNKDGHISMEEAFQIAYDNDAAKTPRNKYYPNDFETPQFYSNPTGIGKTIALTYSLPEESLVIRDLLNDFGCEPNWSEEPMWESPDIWVRNTEDGIEEDENIRFSKDGDSVYIYVRVTNMGKKDYIGGKSVFLNWALASTGLPMSVWNGNEVYPNTDYPTGGILAVVSIPPIAVGESVIIPVNWVLPSKLIRKVAKNEYTKVHFCFLARVFDSMVTTPSGVNDKYPRVFESHGNAQKNIAIVRAPISKINTHVMVRPEMVSLASKTSSIEFEPQSIDDLSIFADAQIRMTMPTKTYNAWIEKGMTFNNVELLNTSSGIDGNTIKGTNKTLVFKSAGSSLDNIFMDANEITPMEFNVKMKSNLPTGRIYKLRLVHKVNGRAIGGETFVIEDNVLTSGGSDIGVLIVDKDTGYELQSPEIGDGVYNVWYDKDDNEIKIGDKIDVSPTQFGQEYKLKVYSEDENTIREGLVRLDPKFGIEKVIINSLSRELKIEVLPSVSNANSKIIINVPSVLNETVTYEWPKGEVASSFPVPEVSGNVIVVTLVVDDMVIETKKLYM